MSESKSRGVASKLFDQSLEERVLWTRLLLGQLSISSRRFITTSMVFSLGILYVRS